MFQRYEMCIAHEWDGLNNAPNACERPLLDDRPFPSVYDDDSPDVRIAAVGDLHGDWACLIRLLELSRMCTLLRSDDGRVVEACRWSGGPHDYLVVCGDCVDMKRGDDDPVAEVAYAEWKILLLLSQLCAESDGHVIRLVGNHEMMLLDGEATYRTRRSVRNDERRAHGDWRRLWRQTDGIYRKLVASHGGYRAVVRINRWIFCHGGVPHRLVEQLHAEHRIDGDRTLEYVNRFYHRVVVENLSRAEMHARHGISDTLYHQLWQVLWTRVYATPSLDARAPCDEFMRMIDRLYPTPPGGEAYRLVVAHCVQPSHGRLPYTTEPSSVSIRTLLPQRAIDVSARVASHVYDAQTHACIYPRAPDAPPECPPYVGVNGDCADATSAHTPRVFRIDCAMSHAFDALFDATPAMRFAREPQILVVTQVDGASRVAIHRFR